MKAVFILIAFACLKMSVVAQATIGEFTSIEPQAQGTDFIIPSTHIFQKIVEAGDTLADGNMLMEKNDFTGYVPINGSSTNGYLSINSELVPGGVSVLDISFNTTTNSWERSNGKQIDFTSVVSTAKNCSGTVTPWNTVVSCEETYNTSDLNNDGYHDWGWCVEIDPVNKVVIDKLWTLGKIKHENIAVHSNLRTVYEGADDNVGYLLKFVADTAQNLHSGLLYVYKGEKNGTGNWLLINNSTPAECNTTNQQCSALGATVFNGIEDVEVGPDGWVYFAVKGENQVYRFIDDNPLNGTTVSVMETFVGNTDYTIDYNGGSKTIAWGNGNDNLAFDNDSNLWVLQDGGNNHIWVVGKNHTQQNPDVRVFANTPIGSEPTGITFSPDNNFLFMSVQSPVPENNVTFQVDAIGNSIYFNKSITLVIARKENLGLSTNNLFITPEIKVQVAPNPFINNTTLQFSQTLKYGEIQVHNSVGKLMYQTKLKNVKTHQLSLEQLAKGIYYISLTTENASNEAIKIVKL